MSSAYYGLVGCDPRANIKKRTVASRGSYLSDRYCESSSNESRKAFLDGQRRVFESYSNGFSVKEITEWVKNTAKRSKTEKNKWLVKGARAALKEIKEMT